MKRSLLIWLVAGLVNLSFLVCGLRYVGWWPHFNFDSSIELSERFGKVENGSAYDRASLDISGIGKVVVPHNAVVRRTKEEGKLDLFMKKTLSFYGHPPEPMSIRDARQNMGCAVRREEEALILATFGEWDSRIEGGAHMRLMVVLPEGIDVETKQGLSGPDSAGREWHAKYLSKPVDARGGHWYGPASQAEGWSAVPAIPDDNRTAGK